MRVAFVHPPIVRFYENQAPMLTFQISRIPPLSGITLAAYIRQFGHKVSVIDGYRIGWQCGNLKAKTYAEILRQATKFKPQLICVTMLTANFYEAAFTIQLLRKALAKAKIVAGGSHPSGEPVATLKQIPELDAVGMGAGEEICLELADGKSISDVDGCAYVEDGDVIFTKPRPNEKQIDKYPFPAWDLIDTTFYTQYSSSTIFGYITRSMGVLTSRGCNGNCYFCSHKWNRPLRMHSPDYVLNLCERLIKEHPIDTIAFWDDTMFASRKRLVKICEELIHRGLNKKVKWFAQFRANQIDEDILGLVTEAGCVYASFGAESKSNRILKILNKGITAEENQKAVDLISESKLLLGVSVIVGSPTETLKEMGSTAKFCKNLPVNTANIGANVFRPLPSSPAYYEFVKTGKINPQKVNWEILGHFGLAEGECYADVDIKTFRRFFARFNRYCYMRNIHSLLRNNINRHPDIVKLYQRHLHYPTFQQQFLNKLAHGVLSLIKGQR